MPRSLAELRKYMMTHCSASGCGGGLPACPLRARPRWGSKDQQLQLSTINPDVLGAVPGPIVDKIVDMAHVPDEPLDLRNFPMTLEHGTKMQNVQGNRYLSLRIKDQKYGDVSVPLEGIRRADLVMRGDWWDDSLTGVKTWGNEDKHGNSARPGCKIEIIEDQELPSRYRRYHLSQGYMTGIKVRWPNDDYCQYYLKDPAKPKEWWVCRHIGLYSRPELFRANVEFTLTGQPATDDGRDSYSQRRRRELRGAQ